jgi:hypothetical protein
MAISKQKRLRLNKSPRDSKEIDVCQRTEIAIEPHSEPKTGGTSGKPHVKIVDPGASWRRFFCGTFTMKAVITYFPIAAHIEGVCCFTWGLSQSLTKSPPFLISQGKEMMLFPASPLVFLD